MQLQLVTLGKLGDKECRNSLKRLLKKWALTIINV